MRGTEEDAEALLLHRGMEAADDGDALVTESLGEIVGVEDEFAGALDGTEEGEFRAVQDGGVADNVDEASRLVRTSRDGVSTVDG